MVAQGGGLVLGAQQASSLEQRYDVVHEVLDPAGSAIADSASRAVDDVVATARRLGDAITAGHGRGRLERGRLARELGAEQRALQHRIKVAFDPRHILDPGNAL